MKPVQVRVDFSKAKEKGCNKCGKTLPLSEFYTRKGTWQSACKNCMKAAARERNKEVAEALALLRAMKAQQASQDAA